MAAPAAAGRAGQARKFHRQLIGQLSDYAAHHRKLAQPVKGGGALRDHLRVAARRGDAESIAELTAPPLAPGLQAVWLLYIDLRRGVHGGRPVGWADLHAWQQVNHCELDAFERDAIAALDAAWLAPGKTDKGNQHGQNRHA